jgi:hypothetical protein
MKVKVTEEKLYPIFKKFMETYFKKYEWRKDRLGIIWFVGPEGYGHLGLNNENYLTIYRDITDQILRYIPMEESMLESLMGRWVGETFQIEGINTKDYPYQNYLLVGETFQIEIRSSE